jgi:hypothetical protein
MKYIPKPLLIVLLAIVAMLDVTFAVAALYSSSWFRYLSFVVQLAIFAMDVSSVVKMYRMPDSVYDAF